MAEVLREEDGQGRRVVQEAAVEAVR